MNGLNGLSPETEMGKAFRFWGRMLIGFIVLVEALFLLGVLR